MGLNPKFYKDTVQTFQMLAVYIEGFYYAAQACILTKYAAGEWGRIRLGPRRSGRLGDLERFNKHSEAARIANSNASLCVYDDKTRPFGESDPII